jgi:hypothetical protein
VPFRKTKAGKIVIGVVVTATVITALAVFLGVWLGLRLRHRQESTCPSLPSCPSTANSSTTPEFLGGTAFALQTNAGDTRIYYQVADGSLRVRSGVGPVTAGGTYNDTLIIAPGKARINTPLAAISWSPENFEQVSPPTVSLDVTLPFTIFFHHRSVSIMSLRTIRSMKYATLLGVRPS